MKQIFIPIIIMLFLGACNNTNNSQAVNNTSDSKPVKVVDKVPITTINTGYDIGNIATDFSLMNIDGKMMSLNDFPDAKGFIITFTCNHCPYAVVYEDRLIALDKKYKTKGYPVIAINPNNPKSYPTDSYENMKIRAKEKGFTFPYLFDDGQKIYPQYGATKTPHVFILQKTKTGNRVEYIGAIDNNTNNAEAADKKFVEMVVDALLDEKEPAIRKTKAIGCSIKL